MLKRVSFGARRLLPRIFNGAVDALVGFFRFEGQAGVVGAVGRVAGGCAGVGGRGLDKGLAGEIDDVSFCE